ncbi:Gfo/Idh/MocA family oxidoreductase [Campylobacter sp. 7477a]|uniref:Gfo/Idh/MocA family oxidoreductase n=1 Tax=Campylobacter sp. 7477a TaxID=2735741 RepID=UPI0030144C62|nr:Gfo/Idh/MocA family oxidoreductase [Campylobacter sp. 7477a]
MKLKIGIVGYSGIAKKHYAILRRSDKFEVCGVFDANCRDDHCRAKFFDDFNSFIEEAKPQAIVLCLSSDELVFGFFKCAKYCKNILIAEPKFKSLSEIKEIKYAATTNKANVCSGMSLRFNPVITSLKRALAKEEEIYSINISHCVSMPGKNIVRELCMFDIDLAKILSNSEIYEFSYSEANKTNARSTDNVAMKLKTKNQILINISNSISSCINRFVVEVNAKSGVYIGDLSGVRLHQLNEYGQINLKVYQDENEIKTQYDEFYNLCQSGESSELSNLDDLIKIKELFA